MTIVEYRTKNVGIVECGVDLWRRTGMVVSVDEKRNIVNQWVNGQMSWDFYAEMRPFGLLIRFVLDIIVSWIRRINRICGNGESN